MENKMKKNFPLYIKFLHYPMWKVFFLNVKPTEQPWFISSHCTLHALLVNYVTVLYYSLESVRKLESPQKLLLYSVHTLYNVHDC